MRAMTTTPTGQLVAIGTNCQHGAMPPRTNGQRTFRLNEQRGKVWEVALAEAGMKQQAAIDTLVDALGLRLIGLNELRAEVIRISRQQAEAAETTKD